MKEKLIKIAKILFKLLFTGLFLYIVFNEVSFEDLKEVIKDSDPFYFIAAFLVFSLSQLISSTRLNDYFKGIGLEISNGFNFRLYLLGMFYNLFLPGGVGGDGYKIYYLKKHSGIKGRRILGAVFFDRLSGLWGLVFLTTILITFIPKIEVSPVLLYGVFIFASIIYYFILRHYFKEYTPYFFRTHGKAILVQGLQLVSVVLILYALQFHGKFSPYLFLFLLSSLVAIFPFTVGGLGAREVVFMKGADFFLLDGHLAVLISLLFYFISALLSLAGAYFLFRTRELKAQNEPAFKILRVKEKTEPGDAL